MRWSWAGQWARCACAGLLAGAGVLGLLALAPGRIGRGEPDFSGTLEVLSRSWEDGRPVWEIVLPALGRTATLIVPALILVLAVARVMALRPGPVVRGLGRAFVWLSPVPMFLLGYFTIVVVNRATWMGIERGLPAPAWFALPVGDGGWSGFKWALQVGILALADGVFGLVVGRLRHFVDELVERPWVLAAEANEGGARDLVRRHLWEPTGQLIAHLIPVLSGGAIVVESVFLTPGAGRLLVDRLATRDLPVVGALVLGGLVAALTVRGILVVVAVERAK